MLESVYFMCASRWYNNVMRSSVEERRNIVYSSSSTRALSTHALMAYLTGTHTEDVLKKIVKHDAWSRVFTVSISLWELTM